MLLTNQNAEIVACILLDVETVKTNCFLKFGSLTGKASLRA